MTHTLDQLMTHFDPWLANAHDADTLASLLERDRSTRFTEPPTRCPRPDVLAAALASAASPLIDAISDLSDHLAWFHPPPEVPEVMRERACAAEFIGPDGVIRRDDLRFGVMAVAAHTDYAAHRHAADELYFVVGGSAEWDVGDVRTTHRTESVVVTPSFTSHAIRTDDEPLLTLYAWTGDISFASYEMI